MAQTYATEVAGQVAIPATKSDGGVVGGRLRRFRATVEMTAQEAADTIVLANIPPGHSFAYGVITASATLGASATIAIGVAGTAAKYRAAAVFTTANTPTLFGTAAGVAAAPVAAGEQVIATIAVATLPSAGSFIVDLYYSAP